VYLRELGKLDFSPQAASFLNHASLAFLVLALCVGGAIIVGAMVRGYRGAPVHT
jgi:hypothetical protein